MQPSQHMHGMPSGATAPLTIMHQTQQHNAVPYQVFKNPFVSGLFAGFAESTAFYWTVTWKNCRQRGIPLPTSIRGFYKGYTMNMACMMAFFSVMTGTNHYVKKEQKQIQAVTGESTLAKFAPAVFGGVAASALLNPVEVTTIQRLVNKDPSLTVTAKKIYERSGGFGFFKGFSLALARNIPYSLALNAIGPLFKRSIQSKLDKTSFKDQETFATVAGLGFAGALAGLMTQPIDNIKTAVQAGQYPNGRQACKMMFQDKGWRVFLYGSVPRTVRIAGGATLAFACLYRT